MAKLALVYGMRLLPADEIEAVGDADVRLKSGKDAHVTMHLLEGGEKEIRAQLEQSLDAFFVFYPEL
jgi:phosphoglycolate phosphatase-like HAD superfamily hydrolase